MSDSKPNVEVERLEGELRSVREQAKDLLRELNLADVAAQKWEQAYRDEYEKSSQLQAKLTQLEQVASTPVVQCAFPSCVEGEKPEWCGHCSDAERADAAEEEVEKLKDTLQTTFRYRAYIESDSLRQELRKMLDSPDSLVRPVVKAHIRGILAGERTTPRS